MPCGQRRGCQILPRFLIDSHLVCVCDLLTDGQESVIGGYTPGNPFDALIVGYYEGDRLLYAAKVRNGFVPFVRRDVASRFKGLEIDTCPFANLPERKRTQWALTKEEMKNCVLLKPELVAQIEFTEWTPDGHLRHSKVWVERR
jgi:ATP-dependent DNA ligase